MTRWFRLSVRVIFPLCALIVTAVAIIRGEYLLIFWPILAAVMDWVADDYHSMLMDSIERHNKLCDELMEAYDKIAELSEELNKLKDGE